MANKRVNGPHKYVNTPQMSYEAEAILAEIAEAEGITLKQAREIVAYPIRYLKQTRGAHKMDPDLGFPNIMLPYLGKFVCSDDKRDKWLLKREQDVYSGQQEQSEADGGDTAGA